MEQELLQKFRQSIANHTGLQIREQEREALEETLSSRAKTLQFSQPEEYYELLESGSVKGKAEWELLIALLTNQESYFFRDKGQFKILSEHILPEIIKSNRKHRTLRLWSAGCSTGEEPFSLAMLVDQLLPQRDGWDICILGTDIKEAALAKARLGIYSPWSFRLVEPGIQQRFFQEQPGGYKLDARICNLVTFRRGNLFKDKFPCVADGFHSMDLILCRNVFIYFEASAVSIVLDKFSQTLRDGGYLMTGHAELSTPNIKQLHPRILPGSVVYQRVSEPVNATQTQINTNNMSAIPQAVAGFKQAPSPAKRSTPSTIDSLVVKNISIEVAPSNAEEESKVHSYASLCRAALVAANLGQHEEATRLCRQAILMDAFAPASYNLLAHIAEEEGDSEEAERLLKKVIYLSPTFIPAYLELAALNEKEGDMIRARKMRAAALELLQTRELHSIVEPYELTAEQIIRQLQDESVG